MITLKLHIKNISDAAFIQNKCNNYSYAFRRMNKMINESSDANFISRFKKTFDLNDIEYRSLLSDVKSIKDRELKQKEKTKQKINELKKSINSITNKHKKFKLLNKISYLNKTVNQGVVFGGRKILSDITNECNKSIRNEKLLNKLRSEYKSNRMLSIFILGEGNVTGNRFFSFKDLSNGIIIYKPKRGIKIEINFRFNKRQERILNRLTELSNNNLLPISIRLNNDFIYLTYNEEILNGFGLDEVPRRKEVNEIKSKSHSKEAEKQAIKDCYKKYYIEQENKKLYNKIKNRCISIDLNPTNIGYSILEKINEKDYKIIHVGCFDYEKLSNKLNLSSDNSLRLKQNNKRKYEITIVVKELFKLATHYKCSSFIMEDLNIKDRDYGNNETNRKIKNIWNRELILNIIKRRCNETGINLIKVNPCYSSFIGNIQHPYGDSASASIEIGRRGLFKYNKGMFYPIISNKDINTMDMIFNDHRDALCETYTNWVMAYKTLSKYLGNQTFQYRLRSMNIRSKEHSFSMNSYKSKINTTIYNTI